MAEETGSQAEETGSQEEGGTTEKEGAGEGQETGDKVEILAKEMGWQPKEDFKGDEANYVDAESFIKKGQDIQDSMRKSLKDQKRQLSEMSSSLTELKSHNERVYKAEVGRLKKELAELTDQKKMAIQDGNVEKVNELDGQIDTVKESIAVPEKTEPGEKAVATTDNFDEWAKANPWYENDKEMAAYADAIATKHEGAPFKRIATLVSKQVKEMFPDKFSSTPAGTTTTTPSQSRVEGAGKKTTTAKFTEADLTDSQKAIMGDFVKQGIMSKKEYIADIATMAGGTI